MDKFIFFMELLLVNFFRGLFFFFIFFLGGREGGEW